MAPDLDPSSLIHVLVVDDQPENLISMEAVLTSPEIRLVLARSGKEALRAVLEYDFALILMDVQMPDMDGFATAELIRQRERSRLTPIIFVTAINKSDRNMYQGYSFGAVDYVFKPFMPEILKSKVEVFVELFRKSSALREKSDDLARVNRKLEVSSQILTADFQATLKRSQALLEAFVAWAPSLPADTDGLTALMARFGEETSVVRRLSASLRDLAESAQGQTVFDRVSLSMLCPQAVAEFSQQDEGLQVRWELQDLPDVWGDEAQLRLVFRHLLSNALRFARGVLAPRIEIGSFPDKKGTVVFIKDNGPGFDLAAGDDLVSTFQSISSQETFEGVGISLVVAQRIIRRHGGLIWASTGPGQGSVVSFLLDPAPPTVGEGRRGVMKIEYINPFVTATLELFQTMMNLELKVGKPTLDQDGGDDLDISGVIGLAGGITGTVVLRFPSVFARRVTVLYSGMEGADPEDFVVDTVGEIVNIISANAKSALTAYRILISIPDVYRGRQDTLPWPSHSPRITVPFECGPERFTLTVGFQEAAS